MIIAVDFDGTVVEHAYPEVGREVPGAAHTLRLLANNQQQLMLWTMRSGEYLADAVKWFEDREIELWGINENVDQHLWTDTATKQYAHIYIDDAALGCPVTQPPGSPRPYVDWDAVYEYFVTKGLVPKR